MTSNLPEKTNLRGNKKKLLIFLHVSVQKTIFKAHNHTTSFLDILIY